MIQASSIQLVVEDTEQLNWSNALQNVTSMVAGDQGTSNVVFERAINLFCLV